MGNGLSINQTDGSHTGFTPHFSNANLLDCSNEIANTISKQDDEIMRNQMMLDAQNHNISTHSSNFSYSDTTASSNNITSNLQVRHLTGKTPKPTHA